MNLVILLEERVEELESLLEMERRTKATSRMKRVEEWDKELRVVRLALQIALEESNLARLELKKKVWSHVTKLSSSRNG